MRAWTLVALGLICLGLGVYIYFEIQKPAEESAELAVEKRIIDFPLEDVVEVRLLLPGQTPLQLKVENESWQITQPFQDIPSKAKIESLLGDLKGLEKQKVILSEAEAKTADLKPFKIGTDETLVLEFKLRGSDNVRTFKFGGPNPDRSGIYVLSSQPEEVYLSSKQIDKLRTESPEDFREKRFLSVDAEHYSEVRITNASGTMKFERKKDQLWEMTEPKNFPIDQSYASTQLSKLSLIRANNVLDKEVSALQKPELKILVGFAEDIRDARTTPSDPRPQGSEILMAKTKRSKQIGGDAGDQFEYFAKSEKFGPATISRFHYDTFNRSWKDYIKKSFNDFSLADIEELVVKTKDTQFTILQKSDRFSWKEESELINASLEKAVNSVRNLRAHQFIEESKTSPKADWTLHIKLKSGEVIGFAWMKSKNEETLWYSTNDWNLKYSLRPGSFDPSLWTKLSLTSPPLEEEIVNETETPQLEGRHHHMHDHHHIHHEEGHAHD